MKRKIISYSFLITLLSGLENSPGAESLKHIHICRLGVPEGAQLAGSLQELCPPQGPPGELFDECAGNVAELQDARLNSDIKKENRGSVPLISSLGRALVEIELYPGTVMDRTVQAYEKERRLLSKILGGVLTDP